MTTRHIHDLRDEAVNARRLGQFYNHQADLLDSHLLRQAAVVAYARAELRERQASELLAEVTA